MVRERTLPNSMEFQSTLPLRGATQIYGKPHCVGIISIHAPLAGSDINPPYRQRQRRYFNPRSPCGERHVGDPFGVGLRAFQSTLPLRGATDFKRNLWYVTQFQSTLPLRGATTITGSPYFR